VSQQVWLYHDKDPSLLKGPEREAFRQPFTGNGDVSMKVKYS
jgi:hypothetical protein